MKSKFVRNIPAFAVAAALAGASASTVAQSVNVSGSLSYTGGSGGVYDYTLTLFNDGPESVESLWLGWKVGNFNIVNPTSFGNNLGWTSTLDGNSVQFGGMSGTALPSGDTGIFTFDSTSTPAQFMAETSGASVAYGVNASQFAIENTTLNSEEFSPTVTPEPSTLGLMGAGILGLFWRAGKKPRTA